MVDKTPENQRAPDLSHTTKTDRTSVRHLQSPDIPLSIWGLSSVFPKCILLIPVPLKTKQQQQTRNTSSPRSQSSCFISLGISCPLCKDQGMPEVLSKSLSGVSKPLPNSDRGTEMNRESETFSEPQTNARAPVSLSSAPLFVLHSHSRCSYLSHSACTPLSRAMSNTPHSLNSWLAAH